MENPGSYAPTTNAVIHGKCSRNCLYLVVLLETRKGVEFRSVPTLKERGETKTPFMVALTPRQTSYALKESKRLQITVPELLRRIVDRAMDHDERQVRV